MSCEIIQFAEHAAAAKETKEAAANDPFGPDALTRYRAVRAAKLAKRQAQLESAPDSLTETCRNKHMRQLRKGPWRKAEVATRYWRARMDWCDALTNAQDAGIKEGLADKGDHHDDRNLSLQKWRDSIAAQLLTPAPDMGAVPGSAGS